MKGKQEGHLSYAPSFYLYFFREGGLSTQRIICPGVKHLFAIRKYLLMFNWNEFFSACFHIASHLPAPHKHFATLIIFTLLTLKYDSWPAHKQHKPNSNHLFSLQLTDKIVQRISFNQCPASWITPNPSSTMAVWNRVVPIKKAMLVKENWQIMGPNNLRDHFSPIISVSWYIWVEWVCSRSFNLNIVGAMRVCYAFQNSILSEIHMLSTVLRFWKALKPNSVPGSMYLCNPCHFL